MQEAGEGIKEEIAVAGEAALAAEEVGDAVAVAVAEMVIGFARILGKYLLSLLIPFL